MNNKNQGMFNSTNKTIKDRVSESIFKSQDLIHDKKRTSIRLELLTLAYTIEKLNEDICAEISCFSDVIANVAGDIEKKLCDISNQILERKDENAYSIPERKNKYSKETFAKMLDGRDITDHEYILTNREHSIAQEHDLVIVYGDSDNLVEFRGAIDDEISCDDEESEILLINGVLPAYQHVELFDDDMDELIDMLKTYSKDTVIQTINVLSSPWNFKIDIPHSQFNLFKNGKLYCTGIIFDHLS